MAFTQSPQGNSHGVTRVRAVGSPFEVSNNATRIPQTLNYVDCYPMKEEQFGSDPLYAVTCREAFKSLSTYDLSTITISGAGDSATPPNNGISPPANLSGYVVSQVGQLLVVDDASTNVGGTVLFCNVMMYNSILGATNSTNAFAVVSLQITVAGGSGTLITPTPTYIFFDNNPTVGVAAIANNNIVGVQGTYIDPYYLIYSAPAALALTIPNGTNNYNIYTQAVAAGMTSSRSITVTIAPGSVVGNVTTGSGFYAGTTITINNSGTILGSGGAGGAGASGGNPGAGNPGLPGLTLNWPIIFNNTSGVIAGGGGGGGGSLGLYNTNSHTYTSGGSGGGGGAGFLGGAGGTAGTVGSNAGNAGGVGQGYVSGTTSGFGGAGSGGNPPQVAGVSGYLTTGNPGVAGGRNAQNSAASGGGRAGAGGNGVAILLNGGAAGNAIQCNGNAVFNVPNGTYTGASSYGTIYGVIG